MYRRGAPPRPLAPPMDIPLSIFFPTLQTQTPFPSNRRSEQGDDDGQKESVFNIRAFWTEEDTRRYHRDFREKHD